MLIVWCPEVSPHGDFAPWRFRPKSGGFAPSVWRFRPNSLARACSERFVSFVKVKVTLEDLVIFYKHA